MDPFADLRPADPFADLRGAAMPTPSGPAMGWGETTGVAMERAGQRAKMAAGGALWSGAEAEQRAAAGLMEGNRPKQEQESWGSYLGKRVLGNVEGFNATLAAVPKLLMRQFGLGEGVEAVNKGLGLAGQELVAGAANELARPDLQYRPGEDGFESTAKNYYGQIVETLIGDLGPTVAAGVVAGPTAGLSLMGAKVFGEQYGQARSEGKGIRDAGRDALASSIIETATEKLPLDIILKSEGSLLRKVGLGWLAEGATEGLTAFLDAAYQSGIVKADSTLQDVMRALKSDETLKNAFDQFVVGGFTGGAAAGAVHLVDRVTGRGSAAETELPPTPEFTAPTQADPFADLREGQQMELPLDRPVQPGQQLEMDLQQPEQFALTGEPTPAQVTDQMELPLEGGPAPGQLSFDLQPPAEPMVLTQPPGTISGTPTVAPAPEVGLANLYDASLGQLDAEIRALDVQIEKRGEKAIPVLQNVPVPAAEQRPGVRIEDAVEPSQLGLTIAGASEANSSLDELNASGNSVREAYTADVQQTLHERLTQALGLRFWMAKNAQHAVRPEFTKIGQYADILSVPVLGNYLENTDTITQDGLLKAAAGAVQAGALTSQDVNELKLEGLPYNVTTINAGKSIKPGTVATVGFWNKTQEVERLIRSGVTPTDQQLLEAKHEQRVRQYLLPLVNQLFARYTPNGKLVVALSPRVGGHFYPMGNGAGMVKVGVNYADFERAAKAGSWLERRRLLSQAKATMLDTMLHEAFGHYLISSHWNSMSPKTQVALLNEYRTWLRSTKGKTWRQIFRESGAGMSYPGSVWESDPGIDGDAWTTSFRGEKADYWLNFEEFTARRLADIIHKKIRLNEISVPTRSFWTGLVTKLKQYFRDIHENWLWKDSTLEMFVDRLSLANAVKKLEGSTGLVDPAKVPGHPSQPDVKAMLDLTASQAGPAVRQIKDLPDNVANTFARVGDQQRGGPEIAMTQAQRALGGGVLSVAIEHTGDLIHRMTHMLTYSRPSTGRSYVLDKVDKVLGLLQSGYGFAREAEENMRSNAAYAGIPYDQYKASANAALQKYREEHSKLPVYNKAHFLARTAAKALGEGDYGKATLALQAIQKMARTQESWDAAATEYALDPNGNLVQYPWPEEAVQVRQLKDTPAKVQPAPQPTTLNIFDSMNRIYGTNFDAKEFARGQAKFNWFVKWMLTLPQIERENLSVPGMREFADAVRNWWATKGQWTAQYDNWVDAVKKSGYGKAELTRLWRFANEVTVQSDELQRKLTPDELAAIARKVGGVDDGMLALWRQGREIWEKASVALEKSIVARTERILSEDKRALGIEVAKIQKDFAKMRNRDYWPLARFGKYTVHVVAEKPLVYDGKEFNPGDTVLFELYETEGEQLARKQQLLKAHAGKVKVANGMVDESLYQYMGMPESVLKYIERELLESVSAFATGNPQHDLELSKIKAKELEALRIAMLHFSPEHSYKQRQLRRKGTKGFSDDGLRAMAYAGQSFANLIARAQHRGEMDLAVKVMDTHRRQVEFSEDPAMAKQANKLGRLINYLRETQKYLNEPQNDWANLRAAGFLHYLAYVPRAAMVQVMQPLFTTGPALASRYGDARALGAMKRAYGSLRTMMARNGEGLRGDLQAAIKRGIDANILTQSLFTELAGLAEGSNLQRLLPGKFMKSQEAASMIRKAGYYGAFMFQKGEEINRLATFHAAHELELRKILGIEGATDAQVEAALGKLSDTDRKAALEQAYLAGRTTVEMTQGEYSRWARPTFMRGGPASTVFLFKMYQQIMTYFVARDPGKWRFLAVQLALAGLMGLPYAEDLLDFLGLVGEKAGLTKGDLRGLVRDYVRELGIAPDLAMHGFARHAIPWDLSASLSLGRGVPGMDPLTSAAMPGGSLRDSALRTQQEALGALFSIPLNYMNAIASGEERDWEKAMPVVIRDVYRTYRRFREGGERDRSGVLTQPIDYSDPVDVGVNLAQALGLRPADIAREGEVRWAQKEAARYWDARRKIITGQFYDLYKAGSPDREALADVMQAIRDFNKEVPFAELGIMPKALKQGLKQAMTGQTKAEAGMPAQRKFGRLYSEVAESFEPAPR